MEVTMESIEDDDLFFADLNKQISLLIMDDEDDPVDNCPTASLQTLSRAIHPAAAESPFGYNHPLNWRRESKGTGVFIPQSLNPRRKNRQGRSFISSSNTKVRSRRHSHNSRSSTSSCIFPFSQELSIRLHGPINPGDQSHLLVTLLNVEKAPAEVTVSNQGPNSHYISVER